MFKITDENYDDYKQIFEILWKFTANLIKHSPDDKDSPLILLTNWEKKSKSLAKKGLKEGLIDLVTVSMNLSIDMKKDINHQLISRGFSGLNHLVSTIKDTVQKVLKRGKIRNLDEYYILKELLEDSAYNISYTEKEQLWRIFENFEIR